MWKKHRSEISRKSSKYSEFHRWNEWMYCEVSDNLHSYKILFYKTPANTASHWSTWLKSKYILYPIQTVHLDSAFLTLFVSKEISPGPLPIICISPWVGLYWFFDSATAIVTAPDWFLKILFSSNNFDSSPAAHRLQI